MWRIDRMTKREVCRGNSLVKTVTFPVDSVAVSILSSLSVPVFLSPSTSMWPSSLAPLHTSLCVPLRFCSPDTSQSVHMETRTHTCACTYLLLEGWLTKNKAGQRQLRYQKWWLIRWVRQVMGVSCCRRSHSCMNTGHWACVQWTAEPKVREQLLH